MNTLMKQQFLLRQEVKNKLLNMTHQEWKDHIEKKGLEIKQGDLTRIMGIDPGITTRRDLRIRGITREKLNDPFFLARYIRQGGSERKALFVTLRLNKKREMRELMAKRKRLYNSLKVLSPK